MKRLLLSRTFLFAATVCTVSCGGGNGSPASPSSPAGPQNRIPVISGVTVNPPSGIQDRTLLTFSANATDPDGDSLTYSWNIAGNSSSGQTVTMGFTGGGEGTAAVTINDGRGGSATATQGFTVITMTGSWTGVGAFGPFSMTLTQTAGFITGSYTDEFGTAEVGPAGELGTIDNNGNISLRVKQAPFADFKMTGVLEGNGRRATGTMNGSGANGEPFVMTK